MDLAGERLAFARLAQYEGRRGLARPELQRRPEHPTQRKLFVRPHLHARSEPGAVQPQRRLRLRRLPSGHAEQRRHSPIDADLHAGTLLRPVRSGRLARKRSPDPESGPALGPRRGRSREVQPHRLLRSKRAQPARPEGRGAEPDRPSPLDRRREFTKPAGHSVARSRATHRLRFQGHQVQRAARRLRNFLRSPQHPGQRRRRD